MWATCTSTQPRRRGATAAAGRAPTLTPGQAEENEIILSSVLAAFTDSLALLLTCAGGGECAFDEVS